MPHQAGQTHPGIGGIHGLPISRLPGVSPNDPFGVGTAGTLGGIQFRGAPGFNEIFGGVLGQLALARQLRAQDPNLALASERINQLDAPLRGQLERLTSLSGSLTGFTDDLRRSAFASTTGAQVAAVEAARTAAGGRGGLAFGGGAGALASRAAQQAATGTSAALADATVRGRLGEADFRSRVEGQRASVAAALSQALQAQGDFFESRSEFDTNLQPAIAGQIAALAAPGTNIQGSLESSGRQARVGAVNAAANFIQSFPGPGGGGF